MDVVLYYAPVACSLVPYVTLTEAKASFTVRPINLRKGQQNTPDYLRLNPKHKVPLLVVDGKTLTENVAIQLWIARSFPAARLLPADPWQELQALSIMSWCSSGIHPLLGRMNAAAKVCDAPAFGAERAEARVRWAGRVFHDRGRDARRSRVLLRTLHDRRRALLLVLPARHAVRTRPSAVPELPRALRAHEDTRPSVQQVLEFEKKTMAEFAAAA